MKKKQYRIKQDLIHYLKKGDIIKAGNRKMLLGRKTLKVYDIYKNGSWIKPPEDLVYNHMVFEMFLEKLDMKELIG